MQLSTSIQGNRSHQASCRAFVYSSLPCADSLWSSVRPNAQAYASAGLSTGAQQFVRAGVLHDGKIIFISATPPLRAIAIKVASMVGPVYHSGVSCLFLHGPFRLSSHRCLCSKRRIAGVAVLVSPAWKTSMPDPEGVKRILPATY